jgi:hypothetical protein
VLTEIPAALSAIKTLGDLTALVLRTKVDSAVTEKAIESQSAMISLQSAMLSLQSQYQSLLRDKDDLEKRLISMENWNAEAQKYSLTQIASGVFVYTLKLDEADAAPPHWLCVNCYEKKQKSILQRVSSNYEGVLYSCPNCKYEILDHSV